MLLNVQAKVFWSLQKCACACFKFHVVKLVFVLFSIGWETWLAGEKSKFLSGLNGLQNGLICKKDHSKMQSRQNWNDYGLGKNFAAGEGSNWKKHI